MTADDMFDECRRHLRYLRAAAARISWPLTPERMAAPDDELVAALDQFAFRFGRLQDTLGQKVFRAVLVGALREPCEDSPMRDVLDRLERLRLLPSADRWEEIRAARNSLAHDYPDTPAQRAARLNLARPMVDEMATILDALEAAVGR
jgi:hypothetical protein